ncbi:hypothetical protein IW261DRAFT_1626791 [Armillaria novae-zelandiae]|uniref:Uncharacterized protein n=1 Tax=Armillaria novae-zelandiae TaxID=153914 RepID=A0AA39P893_9AGAR|nr:hypothetical protein IW261DRAFT_1626791 [Armillaria novae-zelandiae]
MTTKPRCSTQISSQPSPKVKRKADSEGSRVKKTKKAAKDSNEPLHETVEHLQIGFSLAGLSITLPNQNSEDGEIGMIASEQGMALFLVPRADTHALLACGCTGTHC